ncbi:MAG: insulinase family protein [Holosporaceae bacterium]|nr:insulinase family protein [Holosporaceae bacterium]
MKNTKLTTLDTGLRIVTRRLENFDSVVIGYWVEAGTVRENEANNGVSHFLEHMAFKGTSRRTAKQIAEEIESVGGYLNAYTSKEATAFHAKVLKEDRHTALDILSDILQAPTFPSEELELERNVVLQEISQTQDTPDDIIFDYFESAAFQNQPLGRSILGSSALIANMKVDALRAYRDEYYNSDNIVLAAAGDVVHEELVDSVNKYLSGFRTCKTAAHDIKCHYVGGSYSDMRDLEQAYLIIGFNGLANLDSDYYTLALFSSILGGGMSSRLFQEIREKRGLAYSVYSFSSSHKYNGAFGIYAATSPDKLSELSDVASTELLKMREHISEKEFGRAKAQFRSVLLMSQESNSSCCEQIVNQTLIFKRPVSHEEILKKIDAITVDGIKALTDRLLSSNASIVTVGKCDCSAVNAALQVNGIKAG